MLRNDLLQIENCQQDIDAELWVLLLKNMGFKIEAFTTKLQCSKNLVYRVSEAENTAEKLIRDFGFKSRKLKIDSLVDGRQPILIDKIRVDFRRE